MWIFRSRFNLATQFLINQFLINLMLNNKTKKN